MKLSQLKKTSTVVLEGPDGSKAELYVRDASLEFTAALEAERKAIREVLGLSIEPGLEMAISAARTAAAERDAAGDPEGASDLLAFATKLAAPDAIPFMAEVEAANRARAGTYLAGWKGFEEDNGEPIPERLASGEINKAGGATILGIKEAFDVLNAEVERLRREFAAAKEAAAKNSPGPSPVN